MNLTEVRVKLVGESADRLKAYCSITIDDSFVVRDLKVIDGSSGLFVAMPSRKLTCRCTSCRGKNHLRARFCNECGAKLSGDGGEAPANRAKLHADIAHPINAECRQFIQTRVIEEYEAEVERAKDPNYSGGTYDDIEYEEEQVSPYEELIRELKGGVNSHRREPSKRTEPAKPLAQSHSTAEQRTAETSNGGFGAGIL